MNRGHAQRSRVSRRGIRVLAGLRGNYDERDKRYIRGLTIEWWSPWGATVLVDSVDMEVVGVWENGRLRHEVKVMGQGDTPGLPRRVFVPKLPTPRK